MDLFQKEKELWAAAKESPRLLWLYTRLPARAAAIVKLFPHDGVSALLAESYADALEPACEALERDPQAALDVLHRAAADTTSLPAFKASLNAHGWRVVPYAAAFGVPAAARVTPAWLDKAFDAAGRPRDKEWWTNIPLVGGPADLVRSVKNGTVEAGEVGWAALDVVDGVLLVASFGGTSGLTAAKQAAKAGARQGLKSAARAGAGKVATAGVRTATRTNNSLLARVAGRTVVVAGRAGKFVIKPASRAAATAVRALRRGVASLTPVQSKLLARGLLAVGLGVTLHYRTFPALAAWYEQQLSDGVPVLQNAYAAAQKLIDALNGVAAVGPGVLDAPPGGFTWLCRGVVAAAAAYGWWRLTRRRCRN